MRAGGWFYRKQRAARRPDLEMVARRSPVWAHHLDHVLPLAAAA